MVRPAVNSCAIYYGQKNAPATGTSRALYAVEIPACAPHRFDPPRSPQVSRGYRSLQPDVRAHSVAG